MVRYKKSAPSGVEAQLQQELDAAKTAQAEAEQAAAILMGGEDEE